MIQFDFTSNLLILLYFLILPRRGRVQIGKGSKKLRQAIPQFFLCFYFHPVLKGESDILPAVHRGTFHKAVPVLLIKFRQRTVPLFQFCKEPLRLLPLCHPLRDGGADCLQPFLYPVKAVCQPSYFFWYSVWLRAIRAFSFTHCCIISATMFISS